VLNEVAGDPAGRKSKPVRLTDDTPANPVANRQVAQAIDYVCNTVAANPDAAREPLVSGALRRYLAASMLAAFPNTALQEPSSEYRGDTAPAVLRRAISYIDDNAQGDISLNDIADAVYLTPRALQYMFRKHRDCTPMEYLRRVRLDNARRELSDSNRMQTTVAAIAARWGFAHMGRFAVWYRDAYGESPHVTLRAGD
jgi:AraC-like DNA-binding protein